MLDKNEKTNFEEISKLFPGEYEKASAYPLSLRNSPFGNQTVLIYFLGGCTYTELAILRKIADKKSKFIFTNQKQLFL